MPDAITTPASKSPENMRRDLMIMCFYGEEIYKCGEECKWGWRDNG